MAAVEDAEALEEKLEELMEGPQRKEREREKEKEVEPVDLLPIVDSVFGQVGVICGSMVQSIWAQKSVSKSGFLQLLLVAFSFSL